MKPIKEYEKVEDHGDGVKTIHYEDEEGCYYEDLGSFLQCKIVGHCGCGMPEDNLKLIYDMLTMHQEHWDKVDTIPGSLVSEERHAAWKEKEEKIKNYVINNWEKFAYFFWYVMSDKDIMEHGGSVPGWICDENFMDALKIWHEQYEKENKE